MRGSLLALPASELPLFFLDDELFPFLLGQRFELPGMGPFSWSSKDFITFMACLKIALKSYRSSMWENSILDSSFVRSDFGFTVERMCLIAVLGLEVVTRFNPCRFIIDI